MHFADRDLVCVSCGQSFVFTGAEQAFFSQQGFREPRRCKPCRAERKAQGGRGGRDHAAGNGARFGRGRAPAPARVAADDPNGYRAPAFRDHGRDAFAVDYQGLPRDDADGNVAAPDVSPFGTRAPLASGNARPARANGPSRAPRDRNGTNPDAYRSPAFAAPTRDDGTRRESKRARRMRHEATCADCGVVAFVPFQPAPDRPAYCKDCYQVRKANGTVPRPTAAVAPPPAHETDATASAVVDAPNE